MESIHDKLERVRKPRVHIKYEVETEGASVLKELPFVIGVLGDFTGNAPLQAKKSLKERKFIQIDRDNFDEVMARLAPGVRLRVANQLADDRSEIDVNLSFKSMQDFSPTAIVSQVPALKKLLDVRNKLRDLLSKSDRSDQLEAILEQALKDPKAIEQLAKELGIDSMTTGDKA